MQVVINRCDGFFSLSDEALLRLTERGSPAIQSIETEEWEFWSGRRERGFSISLRDGFSTSETCEGILKDGVLYRLNLDIPRNDPSLVAIVEEMGEAANNSVFSKLVVVTIPDDVGWCILDEYDEYSGMESIHEVHRVWTGGEDDPRRESHEH